MVTNGTILHPGKIKNLEVYVDSDFAGNWDPKLAGAVEITERCRNLFESTESMQVTIRSNDYDDSKMIQVESIYISIFISKARSRLRVRRRLNCRKRLM